MMMMVMMMMMMVMMMDDDDDDDDNDDNDGRRCLAGLPVQAVRSILSAAGNKAKHKPLATAFGV